jgi:tryptophan-rich sensory protein
MKRTGRLGGMSGLAAAVAFCLAVGALAGVWMEDGMRGWYAALVKPPVIPPDWLFAPVWTALYVLMAIAAWRVWRRDGFGGASIELAVFGVQLALNLAWAYLFFGRHLISVALLEVAVLWLAVAATIWLFAYRDRIAAWLLVPCLVWVSCAGALNASVWMLNRPA